VAKAQQDLDTARSRRLPKFSLEAQAAQLLRPIDVLFNQGAFGTFPSIGPVPATDTSITTGAKPTIVLNAQAAQPLSQLFRLNVNVRANEATRDVQREELRSGRLEVVKNVKRLYYGILQTESALVATDHTISLLGEINRTVDERLLRRVVLRSDALASSARLAEAEHTRLTLRHTLASRKEQLNQLLGRDVRTAFETAGPPAPSIVEADADAALAHALDTRPDITQARLRLRQAELARRAARADSIPDVSLALSYLSPMNIEGAPRNITSLALQLQWEPFDWGRRGRTVATRDLEITQARNALRDAEDRAVLGINASYRRVEEARSQMRVASATQEAARETARVRANQFRVQAVLLSDVLSAEADQANADNQYQQALLALWQARADYEHALGQEVTQ